MVIALIRDSVDFVNLIASPFGDRAQFCVPTIKVFNGILISVEFIKEIALPKKQ